MLFEDEFVIMPNHLHGIVWIKSAQIEIAQRHSNLHRGVRATGRSPLPSQGKPISSLPSRSLGAFIAGYKASVSRKINILRGSKGKSVWMRNYHDRIIRDEVELKVFRRYIIDNPLKWELDRNYVE